MYKANVNCSILKDQLDFLVKQDLVEKRTIKKSSVLFAITKRGITVLKYFRELSQVLPIIEENRRKTAPLPY
jgi:predicted transcriptional regulator